MRVLHINSGNMYGGVESFLVTLAREAAAAPGMESEFAVCFEGRFSTELRATGCTPHHLRWVRLSRPHTVFRARRVLSRLLQSGSFDVIVCHQPWAYVVFAAAARAAGLPVVLWVHMASTGRHWLERLCRLTWADLVVCNSRFTAQRVGRWLPGSPVEHAYYPVSPRQPPRHTAQRASLRRSLQTAPGDVVIVQVSRMEALKGQRVLLGALSSLRSVPGWTCWIVGGAQRQRELGYLLSLERLARDFEIADRIRFIGERSDVGDVLRAADVYCQPNLEPEGFGLTFVEAMRAGLPVVTSGIGGACEIVDGSCGMLTPPGDVAAVSRALRRLVEDVSLRACLGAGARRRAEMFTDVARQMSRINALLASVSRRRVAEGCALEADLR